MKLRIVWFVVRDMLTLEMCTLQVQYIVINSNNNIYKKNRMVYYPCLLTDHGTTLVVKTIRLKVY